MPNDLPEKIMDLISCVDADKGTVDDALVILGALAGLLDACGKEIDAMLLEKPQSKTPTR